MSTPTIAPAVARPDAPDAIRTQRARRLPYRTISWAVPALLLVVWELLARAGVIAPNVLPAPSSVATTAWRLTETGELPNHLWESLQRAAIGLTIGASIGLVLGVLTGFSKLAEAIV